MQVELQCVANPWGIPKGPPIVCFWPVQDDLPEASPPKTKDIKRLDLRDPYTWANLYCLATSKPSFQTHQECGRVKRFVPKTLLGQSCSGNRCARRTELP